MISSIRHVGIVVSNLETSLRFYRDLLGLPVYKRCLEESTFIAELTGIPGVRLEWVKLMIPKGGLIELLQYHSHPDSAQPENRPSNRLGCSHIAVTVGDLARLYDNLLDAGYPCKSAPLLSPDGKVRIVYAHDPDGTILELIEDVQPESAAAGVPR